MDIKEHLVALKGDYRIFKSPETYSRIMLKSFIHL